MTQYNPGNFMGNAMQAGIDRQLAERAAARSQLVRDIADEVGTAMARAGHHRQAPDDRAGPFARLQERMQAMEARQQARPAPFRDPAVAPVPIPRGTGPDSGRWRMGLSGRMATRAMIERARIRGALTAEQAVQARGLVSEVKTPMGIQTALAGAGPVVVNLGQGINVVRAIPAGSILYVTGPGFLAGDTVTQVLVDGKNIFQNGVVPQAAVDPLVFGAAGFLIPVPITQNITVTVTSAAGAAVISAYLMAPSIEAEGIIDAAAAACACDH
jgi:hypothetical protein